MTIQQRIEEKLHQAFQPLDMQVINESHQHNVPAGSESHFKVVLVTEHFESQRDVARHQSVYRVLADELSGGVHALALHTYTPAEWQQRSQAAPASPDCLGGSKHDQS